VAALRQAMLDVVKPDDLQAIIVRLVLAAQQGDVAAAKLVLAYTLGKPGPSVDPDLLDLHEWALWQQMPVPNEALAPLLGSLQVPLACTLVRTILPLMQSSIAGQLAQHLDPAAPAADTAQEQPKPPCPPSEAVAVPVAGLEGAARRAAPASPCPPAAPAGQPTRKEPKVKREARGNPHGPAGRTPDSVPGPAAGSPREGPAHPNAELQRLLDVCARLLGVDPSVPGSQGVPGSPGSTPPVLQT
jgi:hypothetical protein